ncbi:MAG: dihydroorotase [Nitrospirota bacterium]
MRILIKAGHIMDPSLRIDGIGDILIENGKIKEIRMQDLGCKIQNASSRDQVSEFRAIDATGLTVLPGLVDMHVHLREPGYEHKETIKTGTKAAIKGGFTTVCCMPNTFLVNDNASVTEFIIRKASQEGYCSVYPIGAITKGQRGEELAEIGTMRNEGCIAFSDDGRPVTNSLIMRRALEYSKAFDVPIISHCEDLTLSEEGVMNEGLLSSTLGLRGIPAEAEQIMVFRDILLSELTDGRLHIAHVSAEGSVKLIREAKRRGVRITAETCPHYFSLTEDAVSGYDTNAKVNPPLRSRHDIEAVKEGLADGTIDVIATDHAPHHVDEKLREFDMAPFGISGLETALSLSLRLVHEGILTLPDLVAKITHKPAEILNLERGTLKIDADADIIIVDMEKEFRVEPEKFVSKGKNTPFRGWMLKGMPVMTIVRGKIYEW